MDMEGILATVILAAAIIVALIHHRTAHMTKPIPPVRPIVVLKPSLPENETSWVVITAVVGAWLIWSPILIHWDMPGMNMVLLVLVTVITVGIRPINPSPAMITVLIFHPLNWLMEPLAKIIRWGGGTTFSYLDLALISLITLGNVLGVGAICRWRSR